MMVFLGILVIGFVYEWKKERWNGSSGPEQREGTPSAVPRIRRVCVVVLAPGSGRLHSRSLVDPRSASPFAPLEKRVGRKVIRRRRAMPIEGLLEKGFVTTFARWPDQLGPQRLDVADDFRARVLRVK